MNGIYGIAIGVLFLWLLERLAAYLKRRRSVPACTYPSCRCRNPAASFCQLGDRTQLKPHPLERRLRDASFQRLVETKLTPEERQELEDEIKSIIGREK